MSTLTLDDPTVVDRRPTGAEEKARRRSTIGSFIAQHRASAALVVLLLLLLSAALSAQAADADSGYDLAGLLGALTMDAARLRWQFAIIVVLLGALHYIAAAVAARAAAGTSMRLPETVLVQLAAAAANRLTALGIGGSAVNARFFVRRGLTLAAASGAVAALSVLGAAADILVLALLAAAGWLFGLAGVPVETTLLTQKLTSLAGALRTWWVLPALGCAVIAVFVLRRRSASRGTAALRRFWAPLQRLVHHPSALLTLVAASAGTTLVLALAFAVSTAMVPGPQPHVAIGGLVVGFMIGSAASNAVPTPAGVGATETALVLVLIAAGVPTAHAVEVVIIFRVITFWLPAAVGLLAARHLRRTGAL
jgi:uncharacterized membrane protein YbhN (UPF0104 family)